MEIPTLIPPTFPGFIQEGFNRSGDAALVAFAFFGLERPNSAKLASLTEFGDRQYDSYREMGVGRPELGPFEALGRALVHDGTFAGRYSSLSDISFVTKAYSEIFERTATTSQASHFQSQIAYFQDLYRGAGIGSSEASLLAKGAVAGQMLGFAALDENARIPTASTGFDFF